MARCLFNTALFWLCSVVAWQSNAAELVTLTPQTWDEFAPQGKEVDCIYGDYVLRNEEIVCVIARPVPTRNANMTVRNVGGMLIDLTRRGRQSDQLSAFYAVNGIGSFSSDQRVTIAGADQQVGDRIVKAVGKSLSIEIAGGPFLDRVEGKLKYTLTDGEPFVVVESTYKNSGDKVVKIPLSDALRADRTFTFGSDPAANLFWAHDDWFRQAYGIVVEGFEIGHSGTRSILLKYSKDGTNELELKPGEQETLTRKVFPGDDLLDVRATANKIAKIEGKLINVHVQDPAGDVAGALVSILSQEKLYATGRTRSDGKMEFELPNGRYDLKVAAIGRTADFTFLNTATKTDYQIQLKACGYVAGKITDERGGPIPCKVAFHGVGRTESPDFGPDSAAGGVQNLYYTHDGQFRQELGPGKYEVVISRGPEYNAVFSTIEVARGKTTDINAELKRVVDTTGWISSDFHSHSSPSGDNTGSQFGRVLNLLAEHIEFAPCTEHNRIDSYTPHLNRLGTEHLMATCTGMELTGNPLPVNHQNAFPLNHKPRTQDGGAPVTDANPVVQIERLAMWDNKSDKLVQQNHPHIYQILGDKDTDGKPDEGFEKMYGFMDVIEVHPPQAIFYTRESKNFISPQYNKMLPWMQLLNHGYRIPGVVNTDAHYNYHGSGWLRNYIKCPTDDPAKVETMDMVHASERGNIVMTNGPFMEVELVATNPIKEDSPATKTKDDAKAKQPAKSEGGPGDDVRAPDGSVQMHIRVQCPNWLDVNRVQLFLNGRAAETLNFTRRSSPKYFNNSVVKFDAKIEFKLKEDTHVIVAAAGEGLELGRVMGPDQGKDMPIAVANPIFVDVDGDGFKPNEDDLDVPLPIQ